MDIVVRETVGILVIAKFNPQISRRQKNHSDYWRIAEAKFYHTRRRSRMGRKKMGDMNNLQWAE